MGIDIKPSVRNDAARKFLTTLFEENSMKSTIALALAALLLAGCAMPAQEAAKFEQEYERRVQTYGASCEKIGFKRDTDPWRHCVMTARPYTAIVFTENRSV